MRTISPARQGGDQHQLSPARQGGDRHQKERGFALLLIFFMAAAIAIMLYAQMPRVAFESERDKEQLLIDRGEQYKRAIALFFNDYKRYPSKIEDLEDTNGHRYLRRRYKDPYTGKDEWRLIHSNGMYLTDSLVQKPPGNPANCSSGTTQGVGPALTGNAVGSSSTSNATGGTSTASATGGTSTASTTCPPGGGGATASTTPGAAPTATTTPSANPTDPNAAPQVNAAVLTRPSDRPVTPAGAFPGSFQGGSGQGNSLQAAQNNGPAAAGYIDPASYPPITLFPNGYNTSTPQPGAPQQGFTNPGVPQQGGAQQGVVQPGGFQQSGTTQPGQFQTGVPPGQFQTGVLPGQFQTGVVPGQFPPVAQQPGQFPPVAQQPGIVAPIPAPPSSDPNQAPLTGAAGGVAPGVNTDPLAPGGSANPSQPGFPAGFPPLPIQQPSNQQLPNPQFSNPQTQNAAPAAAPGAAPNQALNLINQLLTTPRQPPSAVTATPASNQTVGGGIAGVASTFTGPTIKSYADHSKYQEWEFVFQLQQQGVPGQTANPLANPLGGTQNGGPPNGAQPGGVNGIIPSGPGTGLSNGPGTAPTPGQSQSPNTSLPPLQ
ncbi:MAG TPA: hypothetical protein VIY49_00810 [Bryobacteraceae bacterium]